MPITTFAWPPPPTTIIGRSIPGPDPAWGPLHVLCRLAGEAVSLRRPPLPVMPDELAQIFEEFA